MCPGMLRGGARYLPLAFLQESYHRPLGWRWPGAPSARLWHRLLNVLPNFNKAERKPAQRVCLGQLSLAGSEWSRRLGVHGGKLRVCTCLGVAFQRGEPGAAGAMVGITRAEGEEIQSPGRLRESRRRGTCRQRDVVLCKDISDTRC